MSNEERLSIGVIGPGKVGMSLLEQLAARRIYIREQLGVDILVSAVSNSGSMTLAANPDEASALQIWQKGPVARELVDLTMFANHIQAQPYSSSVIVDCTAAQEIASRYRGWLERGIHVVTPNKRAGSGELNYYLQLRKLAARNGVRYLYETTVGAALPILRPLRDLILAGDRITRLEGLLSGSLSYIFGSYNGSERFSDVVLRAHHLGLTEPDPREDLSGLDLARKLVILGREIGMDLTLDEVEIDNSIVADDSLELRVSLQNLDAELKDRAGTARAKGQVLRMVGEIEPETGARVFLREYEMTHPFARAAATDNMLRIESVFYRDSPLTIQGSGAGPGLTAAGLLTDLLRITSN